MKRACFLVFAIGLLALSCGKSQNDRNHSRILVYTTDLKDDSAAIAAYDYYHNPKNIWPEINQAAKNAGFESITIHRYNNRLVMILQIPLDADKKKMDSLYAATSPRLKDWAKLTGNLQQGPPGSMPGETWVVMKEVYHYQQ